MIIPEKLKEKNILDYEQKTGYSIVYTESI